MPGLAPGIRAWSMNWLQATGVRDGRDKPAVTVYKV